MDREFLEHDKAELVANVQSLVRKRCAAATDGVVAGGLHGLQVLFELRVVERPEATFAPLLVVGDALDLQNLVVQVVVALEAVELAETEGAHHGECVFGALDFLSVLFLAGLDFHLEFNGVDIGVLGAPLELVALLFLDFENKTLGHVFLVELQVVHELLVNVAIGVAHEHAESGLEAAGVIEADFAGDALGVGIGFELHVRNEGCGTENQVHMAKDTAKGVLGPGEADREFARVYKAVIGAVGTFAAKVNTAVECAHVGNAHAEHVFFAELQGLLEFNNKRSVGAKVGAQKLAVQPNGGVAGNTFETQENALGNLLFVIDGKTLEVEGAVVRHQKLVKSPFPNVGDLHFLGVFGVSSVPTIRNTGIFGVPNHLPVAIKAQNLAHSSFLYEILR